MSYINKKISLHKQQEASIFHYLAQMCIQHTEFRDIQISLFIATPRLVFVICLHNDGFTNSIQQSYSKNNEAYASSILDWVLSPCEKNYANLFKKLATINPHVGETWYKLRKEFGKHDFKTSGAAFLTSNTRCLSGLQWTAHWSTIHVNFASQENMMWSVSKMLNHKLLKVLHIIRKLHH